MILGWVHRTGKDEKRKIRQRQKLRNGIGVFDSCLRIWSPKDTTLLFWKKEMTRTARGRGRSRRCRGSSGIWTASCGRGRTQSGSPWHPALAEALSTSEPHGEHLGVGEGTEMWLMLTTCCQCTHWYLLSVTHRWLLTKEKNNKNHDHGEEALVPIRRQPVPYSQVENRTPSAQKAHGHTLLVSCVNCFCQFSYLQSSAHSMNELLGFVCWTAVPLCWYERYTQDEVDCNLCIEKESHSCPLQSHCDWDFLRR